MAVNEGQARQWAVFSVASRRTDSALIEIDVVISSWPYAPRPGEVVVQVVTLHGPYQSVLAAQAARLVGVGAYPDMGSALDNSWRWNRQAASYRIGWDLGRV